MQELRLRSSKEVWKNDSPPDKREIDKLRCASRASGLLPPEQAACRWRGAKRCLLLLLLISRRENCLGPSCRQQTWTMFDFGFKNYMQHAFPQVGPHLGPELLQCQRGRPAAAMAAEEALRTGCSSTAAAQAPHTSWHSADAAGPGPAPSPVQDNLLPISCKGQNWQGGMALTLVDALDALMVSTC